MLDLLFWTMMVLAYDGTTADTVPNMLILTGAGPA